MNYINYYYKYLAFQNNIIINILLFVNYFFPKQIKNKLIYYMKKKDEYNKYIFLLTLNSKIEEKFKINILNMGLKFYNNILKDDDNIDLSDLDEDLSDLDEDL